MKVWCRTVDGQMAEIDVHETDTLAQLKVMIELAIGPVLNVTPLIPVAEIAIFRRDLLTLPTCLISLPQPDTR
jgi:hypothetical protein